MPKLQVSKLMIEINMPINNKEITFIIKYLKKGVMSTIVLLLYSSQNLARQCNTLTLLLTVFVTISHYLSHIILNCSTISMQFSKIDSIILP